MKVSNNFATHLCSALASAPDTQTAARLLDILEQTLPDPAQWPVRTLAKEIAARPGSKVFAELDRRGHLKVAELVDAIGLSAAINDNEPLLREWSAHPQAQAMTSSERGRKMVLGLLQRSAMNETVNSRALKHLFRRELTWQQQTLDDALRALFTARDVPVGLRATLLPALLRRHADPCVMPHDDPRGKPAVLLFAHKLRDHTTQQASDLLKALHCSPHWAKALELYDRKRSFVSLLAQSAPMAELVTGLDKGAERWWDGDPYGLVDLVIQRAHREPELLIAMTQHAVRDPVETGMAVASMPGIFSALFVSSGKETTKTQSRLDFWRDTAPAMSRLWLPPASENWLGMCARTHDFERSDPGPEGRKAFVDSLILEMATPQAISPSRRRNL